MDISSLIHTQIPPTFLAPTPLAKDIHHIIGSTIMASTIHTKTMDVSTVTGSTIQANTLQMNTLAGSTIQVGTLSLSTIVGSTIQANTFVTPNILGSIVQASTSYYNTLIGSTISTISLQVASLTGSTIQTNTLGFFDTKVSLDVLGEYITFDFGTDGRYYDRFSYTRYNNNMSNTINRINFIGSNDNITWFSIGSPIGEIISGPITTVRYIFTPTNYRYLRVIITEIKILTETSQNVSVSDYSIITVDNYYKSINTMTLSPNLTIFVNVGSGFVLSIQGSQYGPMTNGGYASYIGSLTTMVYTGEILPKKPAIVALTTSTIQTNALQVSSLIGSTVQTDVLQTSSIIGSTVQSNAFMISTVFGSTIRTGTLQVSTLYTSDQTIGSTIQANVLLFSTIAGSTIQTGTCNGSTITTNTLQMNRFSIETLTLSGNTINISGLDITTLTGSTFVSNAAQASTLNVKSTLIGSTIQTNVLNGNAVIGSTFQTRTLQVSTLTGSTLIGSTIQATRFTGTNITVSTIQTNTLQVSTIVGSTIQSSQFIVSTILGSTIRMNLLTTSTIVGSTIQTNILDVSTVIGSTIQVSTIGISTIIGSTIRTSAYTASTITGSTIQANTLLGSTILCSSIIGSTIQTPRMNVSTISSSTIIGNNFQANKIVITDGNNELSTSITNASQLQYITNLTSQVSKTGQANEWTATQTFSTSSIYFNGLITSTSPSYTLGLNASNQLVQFSNMSGGIQGLLTSNYIPYASAVSTLSNSIIYRVNATDLAIGQTTSAFPTGTGSTIVSVAGLTQTTRITATSGTFSKFFMADKRSGLNGTVISGNNGCNFYMGTMNNNGSGNYTDTLYLNSWGDGSAGNVNAVMFNKSAIGMRIYQGAVGAASNFTVFADAIVPDANSGGNLTLGAGSDYNGITFGPNVTWSSYLKIGSGQNRIGTNTAQVISTNGNLHIDSATNTRSLFFNHYAKQIYGTGTTEINGAIYLPSITQQTDTFAYPVGIADSDNTLHRYQLLQRNIYRNNSVGWGGGVFVQYAFYIYTTSTRVLISGKMSYWVDSPRLAYPYLRVGLPNGEYWYYSLLAYTNNGGNHVTFPFQVYILPNQVGWHSVYMYNNGSANTDGNDQLWINVTLHSSY